MHKRMSPQGDFYHEDYLTIQLKTLKLIHKRQLKVKNIQMKMIKNNDMQENMNQSKLQNIHIIIYDEYNIL